MNTTVLNYLEFLALGKKTTELKKISDALSDRYLHPEKTDSFIRNKEEAFVYTSVRFPATYSAVSQSLKYALEVLPHAEFVSMLDVGAGTGAATVAATDLLPISDCTCLEKNSFMSALGKELFTVLGLEAKWRETDIERCAFGGKYDLVVASYALNELSESGRISVLQKLLDVTGKLLLIVEPGTVRAFLQQKQNRSFLLGQGARVVAPCPHACECPVQNGDWCHFSVRVPRSKLHKTIKGGTVPYEDEKFTYLAFSTSLVPTAAPDRLLRHPQIFPKQISLTLCTENGITAKTLHKNEFGYKTAKKLSQGDAFIPDNSATEDTD